MTARVMLALEEGQTPDGEWLDELFGWDMTPLWSERQQRRAVAMIVLVAARHTAVVDQGPSAWPTLPQLSGLLSEYGGQAATDDVQKLLLVAVASGWLAYEDVRSS